MRQEMTFSRWLKAQLWELAYVTIILLQKHHTSTWHRSQVISGLRNGLMIRAMIHDPSLCLWKQPIIHYVTGEHSMRFSVTTSYAWRKISILCCVPPCCILRKPRVNLKYKASCVCMGMNIKIVNAFKMLMWGYASSNRNESFYIQLKLID